MVKTNWLSWNRILIVYNLYGEWMNTTHQPYFIPDHTQYIQYTQTPSHTRTHTDSFMPAYTLASTHHTHTMYTYTSRSTNTHTHMHIDMNERARTTTTGARELTYQYCDSHTSWSSQWNERDMNAFIVAYVLIELEFEWTFCGWHIWNW